MKPVQHVICPFCGKGIMPGSHFCIFCGKDVSDQGELQLADSFSDPDDTIRRCDACGAIITPYARYCSGCGRDLRLPASLFDLTLERHSQIAIDAAKCAGTMAKIRHNETLTVREKTAHLDYVTDVDTGCEAMIRRTLLDVFPDDQFFGEECGVEESKIKRRLENMEPGERIWVVDPLDGTVNYVHGLGLYCVSVALVESGETTCGVIYIPESDELFVAEKGRGAWLNGKPIRVSSCNGLDDALMGYSVPAVNMDYRDAFIKCYPELSRSVQNVRMLGSCAVGMAYVACGRLDGYIELGHHPWDIAAGMLIVSEAGGKGTDFAGERLRTTDHQMIVSNGRFHERLTGMMNGIQHI